MPFQFGLRQIDHVVVDFNIKTVLAAGSVDVQVTSLAPYEKAYDCNDKNCGNQDRKNQMKRKPLCSFRFLLALSILRPFFAWHSLRRPRTILLPAIAGGTRSAGCRRRLSASGNRLQLDEADAVPVLFVRGFCCLFLLRLVCSLFLLRLRPVRSLFLLRLRPVRSLFLLRLRLIRSFFLFRLWLICSACILFTEQVIQIQNVQILQSVSVLIRHKNVIPSCFRVSGNGAILTHLAVKIHVHTVYFYQLSKMK